jgi:hypothetical protein
MHEKHEQSAFVQFVHISPARISNSISSRRGISCLPINGIVGLSFPASSTALLRSALSDQTRRWQKWIASGVAAAERKPIPLSNMQYFDLYALKCSGILRRNPVAGNGFWTHDYLIAGNSPLAVLKTGDFEIKSTHRSFCQEFETLGFQSGM